MSIAITATYNSYLNPANGVWFAEAVFVVTGLTASSDNVFSATSDGTSSGTALLPASAPIVGKPDYTPTDGNGSWYEKATPDSLGVDASGNMQFSITSGSSGPTAFRIAVRYGSQ
jgi:hypothetical protein